MRGYETLVAVYFAVLAAVALVRPAPNRGPLTRLFPLLALAWVVATAALGTDDVREWMPLLYLILGYWLPALLAATPHHPTRFEQWLCRSDERWRPRGRIPSIVQQVCELAYLLCYPLVPAAFVVVWLLGSAGEVDRFWMAVLMSAYACYASLPWLASRPPRLVSAAPVLPGGRVAALNARVLGRVSHQMTTFPSGHVAVSIACAAGVFVVSAGAGVVFGLAALAIAIGAVAGRYHYAIDVALGVVVAVVASLAAFI